MMSTPMPSTSFTQLAMFVAIVDSGSFAAAGRQLGMSRSAISKTITRFEETHAIRLLNRSTHALSLTEEGEQLIALAREALQSVAEFEAAASESGATGVTGRVRINAPSALITMSLVPALPVFCERHPEIQLDLRGSNDIIDLAAEGVDLALRAGDIATTPGYIQTHLFKFAWVTCAAPSYLEAHGIPQTPMALKQHRLIGFRNDRTGMVESWLYRPDGALPHRVSPGAALLFDDAVAAAGAVHSGVGIAWAPKWLVASSLESGALVPLLEDWEILETSISIVRRDRRLTPARVRIVIDWLKAIFRDKSAYR